MNVIKTARSVHHGPVPMVFVVVSLLVFACACACTCMHVFVHMCVRVCASALKILSNKVTNQLFPLNMDECKEKREKRKKGKTERPGWQK